MSDACSLHSSSKENQAAYALVQVVLIVGSSRVFCTLYNVRDVSHVRVVWWTCYVQGTNNSCTPHTARVAAREYLCAVYEDSHLLSPLLQSTALSSYHARESHARRASPTPDTGATITVSPAVQLKTFRRSTIPEHPLSQTKLSTTQQVPIHEYHAIYFSCYHGLWAESVVGDGQACSRWSGFRDA